MKQGSLPFQLNDRFEMMQAARGFCAVWIVLRHFLYDFDGMGGGMFSFIWNAEKALATFFMIAGFVTLLDVEKMLKNGMNHLGYLEKRLVRIYIPYLFSLLFAVLIIPLLLAFLVSVKNGFDSNYFLLNLKISFSRYSLPEWLGIIMLTRVFSADSWLLYKPFAEVNAAVWFIAVLMQMYLVVALAMMSRRFFYWILGAVTLISYVIYFFNLKEYVPYGLFLIDWPQFSAGFILYAVLKKGWRPVVPRFFYFLIVLIYAVGIGFLAYRQESLFYFALWASGLFWLIYPYDEKAARFPVFRFFAVIGVFSYSLYLMHIPLRATLTLLEKNLLFWLPVYPARLFFTVPAAIILSYFWYLFFEKKLILKKKI